MSLQSHLPNASSARRTFLQQLVMAGGAASLMASPGTPPRGFRSLFDGNSLTGWRAAPRLPVPKFPGAPEPSRTTANYARAKEHTGLWVVENGAIVGGQNPPGSGLGAYLVSEETFGDCELLIDALPDWPADTGVLLRSAVTGNPGMQVLIDHRPEGGIGGYFGNGLASFRAYAYGFNAELDSKGRVTRLLPVEAPAEHKALLSYAAPVEEFLKAWKVGDWNQFRIRSVGAMPRLTTWINGVKISELDTAAIKVSDYDPAAVLKRLGPAGHISLEVHNRTPQMGDAMWGKGAVCRWRNIFVKTL